MPEEQGNMERVMVHYLLEMHKGGNVMAKLELNVPVESFPAVKMQQIQSLEALLVDYGKKMGYKDVGTGTRCPECGGSGQIQVTSEYMRDSTLRGCPACKGTGTAPDVEGRG